MALLPLSLPSSIRPPATPFHPPPSHAAPPRRRCRGDEIRLQQCTREHTPAPQRRTPPHDQRTDKKNGTKALVGQLRRWPQRSRTLRRVTSIRRISVISTMGHLVTVTVGQMESVGDGTDHCSMSKTVDPTTSPALTRTATETLAAGAVLPGAGSCGLRRCSCRRHQIF